MDNPTNDPKDIAVTGATGQQGRVLVERLLQKGHQVRAVTRNPDSAAALELARTGARVVRADLDANEGLAKALDGADGVFLLTTPFERGAKAELEQAGNLGRAAATAKIAHVVYSSVTKPMTFSPVEHFAAKGEAERLLESLELPLTIVGAPPFLDNLIAPWHLPWLRRGIFALPVPDDMPMQMVLTRDIAGVAAHVLERPASFIGERVDIATEAITGARILTGLESATGRTFERRHLSFAELDPLLGKLFAGIEQGPPAKKMSDAPAPPRPPSVDLAALRQRLDGVEWSSYDAWVRELDWNQLLEASDG